MISRNNGKPSSANNKRNEDSVVRHSSNGVKSVGKTNNMSSGIANGTSTSKREVLGKTNGASTVKRENSEKGNGSAVVKREIADVKKVASISGAKTVFKKTSAVTKVVTKEEKKKVFTLPGQKHEPPEEREPLRIFYESLHEQNPDSEMAEFWMMEHGLLSPENANSVFQKKQKRGSSSSGTQVKSSTPSRDTSKVTAKTPASNGKRSASKVLEQKGTRKWEHDDSDDDLLIARPLKRKLKI